MSNYASDMNDRARMHGWWVYVIAEDGDAFTKIGTAAAPVWRLAGLQTGNPRPLRIVQLWKFNSRDDALAVERAALRECEARLPGRDWVTAPPNIALAAVERAIDTLGIQQRVAA